MTRWPDFFIVGAPKAGTSSLYQLLKRSSGICMASVKEPRFFNVQIDHSAFMSGSVTDEAAYLRLFNHCSQESMWGEASPSYLVDPDTPKRILARAPLAKIVVMIRDPVERAYSHYLFHEVRTGRSGRTFGTAIDECVQTMEIDFYHPRYLLQPGFYARQISRYIDVFGADRVLTTVYDDFTADTRAELSRVCDFLGVASPEDVELTPAQRNASGAPRNAVAEALMTNRPLRWVVKKLGLGADAVGFGKRFLLKAASKQPMGAAERERLMSIYAEDVAQLEELLDRSLPWPIAHSQR